MVGEEEEGMGKWVRESENGEVDCEAKTERRTREEEEGRPDEGEKDVKSPRKKRVKFAALV